MPQPIDTHTWLWAIVQDPEKDAQILGQKDIEADISLSRRFSTKKTPSNA